MLLDLAEIAYQSKILDVYQSIITSIHSSGNGVKINWQNQQNVPAPTNFSASVNSNNHVILSWQNNAEPALVRNHVKRAFINSENWEVIADLPGSITSYTDKTATEGNYNYMIEAISYSQDSIVEV